MGLVCRHLARRTPALLTPQQCKQGGELKLQTH